MVCKTCRGVAFWGIMPTLTLISRMAPGIYWYNKCNCCVNSMRGCENSITYICCTYNIFTSVAHEKNHSITSKCVMN